ncbi:nitroreductase family protein [Aeropyrum camini]|uniref:NADH dehydrogenase n=1 Tax=Aeropyrum camini SY1 = JCM 12091 TaxID=1198449 RepID=U3TDR5_9CREN|nr:nitroreductase family protein [Aeropyrum camini]BAN90150.1 NADH dehydrogenase [Aeropyrum camini SY1 = JCM 12091]
METAGVAEAARVVYEVFSRHRSIRKYVKKPLPEEHVNLLMEAARRAPTDATLHLWSAVRVVDDGVRRRLATAIGQEHVYEAGEFFVFLADFYRLKRLLEHRGEELGRVDRALLVFSAIDAGLAAENMAVMAEALGYGTCFIGGVQNAAELIIDLLDLPEKTYPLFGLTIGYPAEDPPLRPRLPADLLFHTDRYRRYSSEDLARAYEAMASYSRRRDWLRILKRYVAVGGYFETRSEEMWRLLRRRGFEV